MARKTKKVPPSVSVFSFVIDRPLTDDQFRSIGELLRSAMDDLVRDPAVHSYQSASAQIFGAIVLNDEGLEEFLSDIYENASFTLATTSADTLLDMTKGQ